MTRSSMLPIALTLLTAPLLGGGICGVRFQKSPVPEAQAKADPALFGTWTVEKSDRDASDAETLQVFKSDGARTVFMMSGQTFRVESNTVDTMTFMGHPFATASHHYLALRSATIRQDDIGDPARAVPSGDVTIVRYRITDDTLHIDTLDDESSIAAVQKRAVGGTYVKAAGQKVADDQLRIDDDPAAVLQWLDGGAKWEPYEYIFRRHAAAAPAARDVNTPKKATTAGKKKARGR